MEIVKTLKDNDDNKAAALANYELTPLETALLISWVYEKDLREAIAKTDGWTVEGWDTHPEERKRNMLDLVEYINADMLANAWELMKDATLQAVSTMVGLLKSDDDNIKARAAQFIIEQQYGKAKTVQEVKGEVEVNIKGYAIGVAPEDWDVATVPALPDGDDDVIDGIMDDGDL